MKLGVAALLALNVAWSRPSVAADAAPERDDAVMRGPVLPAHLVPTPRSLWRVGLGLEHFGTGFDGSDYLAALAVTYHYRAFAPNLLFLAKPRIATKATKSRASCSASACAATCAYWAST